MVVRGFPGLETACVPPAGAVAWLLSPERAKGWGWVWQPEEQKFSKFPSPKNCCQLNFPVVLMSNIDGPPRTEKQKNVRVHVMGSRTEHSRGVREQIRLAKARNNTCELKTRTTLWIWQTKLFKGVIQNPPCANRTESSCTKTHFDIERGHCVV